MFKQVSQFLDGAYFHFERERYVLFRFTTITSPLFLGLTNMFYIFSQDLSKTSTYFYKLFVNFGLQDHPFWNPYLSHHYPYFFLPSLLCYFLFFMSLFKKMSHLRSPVPLPISKCDFDLAFRGGGGMFKQNVRFNIKMLVTLTRAYVYILTSTCDLPFMPQSQVPYGDRTAPVRCQILQNRTVTVRTPYDFCGHRTVAVAFSTHRTMHREVLTRRYNCLMHRTMFQLQTASYGRRAVAVEIVRAPYDFSMAFWSPQIVRSPYGHRRSFLVE